MNPLLSSTTRTTLFLLILLINGCSTSPTSHFYMLTPLDQANVIATSSLPSENHIVIGPISFPGYLDRPHIVTRSANAEIHISEVHRWAEPVQENFTRVLAENLSQLLGTERISIAPSRDRAVADYRVTMEVMRFDASRDGEVILVAYWNVYARQEPVPITTRKSEHRLPASRNATYNELVAALSTAVAQISREIAATIPQ